MNILQLMVQLGIKGTGEVQAGLEGVEEQAHATAEGVKKTGGAVREAEGEFEHFKFGALGAGPQNNTTFNLGGMHNAHRN